MLLKKNQSVVRFRLDSTSFFSQSGWREDLRTRLEENHFADDGPIEIFRSGFVDPWHLSTVTFEDHNRWMFDPNLVIGFRIDRRAIPKNLFDATLQGRVAAWCAERDIERCPSAVKAEIKENLKKEWLRRVLPRVKHLQLSIDIRTGDAHLFGGVSESDSDQLRKQVFRLLGIKLVPWNQARWFSEDLPDPLLQQAVKFGISIYTPPSPSGEDGGSEDEGGE
jgi:DNA recombination-dependent growth factor C